MLGVVWPSSAQAQKESIANLGFITFQAFHIFPRLTGLA